jgi:hypothetical protein
VTDYNPGALAHRVVYEEAVGPIPEGLTIDHLCKTKDCVNPEHLEPVEWRENAYRAGIPSVVAAVDGVCRKGHLLEGHNVVWERNSRGTLRRCRECRNATRRRVRTAESKVA